MSLIKVAKESFPDAWETPTSADTKARAVAATAAVLETLRRQYGSGQVDAVIRGLLGDD